MRLDRLLIIVLFLSALLPAQTVTGTVVGPTGSPVVGATLEFGGGAFVAVTTVAGAFSLVVPVGTYEVDIDPVTLSLAPARISAVVTGSQSLGVITLQPGLILSGAVTDSAGLPVVTADMNVYDDVTGVKLYTPGDNTNALGAWSVVVPAGVFRVRATPPTGVVLVATEVSGVVVSGPTTVPTIALPPGFLLTGVLRNRISNAALPGVDIDVDNAVTGARIPTPGDTTSSTGAFSVVVPAGTLNVSFEPPVGVALRGRRIFGVSTPAGANMGTILLDPGAIVTGTVRDALNAPVPGAELEASTTLGNQNLFVANDLADSNGNFSVVLPAANLELVVLPPAGSTLVGERRPNVAISGTTALPQFTLQPGLMVSGTVTGVMGPEPGARLDFINASSGIRAVTPNAVTSASGSYAVRVAAGTWDIAVRTTKARLSRDTVSPSTPIGSAQVINFNLPLVPSALFVDAVGPTTLTQSTPVQLAAVIFNPTPSLQNVILDFVLVNPDGTEIPIFPSLNATWPPFLFEYQPSVSVALPSVNPAFLGLPFQVLARFRDPITSEEIDVDSFTVVIQ